MATPAQLAEKGSRNQDGDSLSGFATPAQLSEKKQNPPALPPRAVLEAPPPYSANTSDQWNDPRSSSTHSLVPSESNRDGRRTLLNIFIHGFMGNETSFQSFPAHLHNVLTNILSETHVVHTKIYPRYKSRKAIDFARDHFSTWLEPHENDYTDIILYGHSMGGILSAEVALLRPRAYNGLPFRHRILGTISFDTPFLGMHPGVITSGIGSLFRSAPEPPGTSSTGASTPFEASTSSAQSISGSSQASLTPSSSHDPYYDPPFPNDVRIPERSGWSNFLHFVNKHSDGFTARAKLNELASATSNYFMSHIEFGSCLADYKGLQQRYSKLRSLEDVDELAGRQNHPPARRVRFVNYYTASTGRPKSPKTPKQTEEYSHLKPVEGNLSLEASRSRSPSPTPSITVSEHSGDLTHVEPLEEVEAQVKNLGEESGVHNEVQESDMQEISPKASQEEKSETVATSGEPETTKSESSLPAIPHMPTEPTPIDLESFTDKDARETAEKEQKQAQKAYQQALKNRENVVKEIRKLIEKQEKQARKEKEKQHKAEQKQKMKEEKARKKEEEKRKATINPEPIEERPKKDRKFCVLPSGMGGKRDKCWVRVYMDGVDEVGAHCGLFFPGPQYESLVADVGSRVEEWVLEDATRRAIIAAEAGD